MNKIFLFLCLLLLSGAALQAQDEKLRVAVFDPTSRGDSIEEGTKVSVREIISSTFVNTGKYNILERSLLQKVLDEQAFSHREIVDESQATELGRLAGANKVVLTLISLSKVKGSNTITIKMIDVKTATVELQKTQKGVTLNDLLDVVERLTLELLGEKPSDTSGSSKSKKNNLDEKPSRPPGLPPFFGSKGKEDKKKIAEEKEREEAEKDSQTAATAANSYSMAKSVSDMILQDITKQKGKKANKYVTDVERYKELDKKEEIVKYIKAITSDVGGFPKEDKNVVIFFCAKEQDKKDDMILLFFMDGNCIGIGSRNKGLLTKISNSQTTDVHNISIWNHDKELFSSPINITHKTYYKFGWNKNELLLIND